MVHGEPVDGLPELDLDNLALLEDGGAHNSPIALTARDEITQLPAWLFGETPDESGTLHNSTACVVILVESVVDSSDLGVFYFYFYSYNRGANITQVLQPIKGLIEGNIEPGMHFGDHVGDWEYNMVRFRDGKPTGIYFSQHSDGAAYEWGDAALAIEDERRIWLSRKLRISGRWDPVSSAYFYRLDPVTSEIHRIYPPGSPQESNFTSAIYFSGLWGDFQYPDDDFRQETVPHFGLKRYVSGPSGPITKQLVRKGLFPDHPQEKSWLQWGIRIFMSLYPCCLRGWRVWVSGILLVGALVSMVLGIRYAVRRYRSPKGAYQKVEAGEDVPLDIMGYSDDIATQNHPVESH
ncbi:hypothetical protein N0V82_006535 [Gnomoniopsis sp. IMI 355080]|nr:hypothetical protein N0V82_006535 [Gnomoniopsis sp. IMI 355080]